MKTHSTLTSLTRTLGSLPALPVVAAAASNLFGRRSRRRGLSTASSPYLIAGGVLAGAAALLLNPWNGRDLRSRVGKLFGGGLGKLVGEQIGAHPIGTGKAVRKTQELLGTNASR